MEEMLPTILELTLYVGKVWSDFWWLRKTFLSAQ